MINNCLVDCLSWLLRKSCTDFKPNPLGELQSNMLYLTTFVPRGSLLSRGWPSQEDGSEHMSQNRGGKSLGFTQRNIWEEFCYHLKVKGSAHFDNLN